ncbi:MAG: terminase large subunit [Clostridiales bacterium]|nr:terminase large subunit [Clostridiales bacterium]
MTYIEQYWEKIKSGEINACRKVKIVYEYLVYCLHHDMVWFEFNELKGNKPIEFIETFCRNTQGRNFGKPLKLELFQKARRQATFGFVHKDSGLRQYTETMLVEGRKNGKTTENACDSGFMLIGDGEGSAECYAVATKKDQALKTYNEFSKMVSLDDDLKKYVVNGKAQIEYPSTFSFMRALGSKDLDSFNAHFVVIDELAAIKKRSIYDDMKQSTSSRDQPLVSSISTNNFVRDNIFDAQYEYASQVIDFMEDFLKKSKKYGHEKVIEMVKQQERTGDVLFQGIIDFEFLPFIYELDDRKEWEDESCWIKANPGLGPIKKIETLRGYVRKAKKDLEFRATVMVKDFNMKENATTRWLLWEDLENLELIGLNERPQGDEFCYDTFEKAFKSMGFNYGIGCFDFAETTDLAAAKILCMRENDPNIYVLSMYWMPEDYVDSRTEEDKIPYRTWVNKGFMRTCQGYKVRKADILSWFQEVQDKLDIYIFDGGYDPWHVSETEEKYLQNNFGKSTWKPVRQGPYTLSGPMHELKEDLKANIVVYNDNPIDKWCLSNIEVKTDTNGNISPVKPGYGDKNSKIQNKKKIDGAVALIIGYVRLKERWDDYQNMI